MSNDEIKLRTMTHNIDIAVLHELYRYDAETGHFYLRNDVVNRRLKAGQKVGWVVDQGYVKIMVRGKHVLAHRAAWAMTHGYWPPELVDHINMDRADNRISNLRLATAQQNSAYSRPWSKNGRRGVVFQPKDSVWRAHITHKGKHTRLGNFATVDEAAHAYNKAAVLLHGDFAILNPIGADTESIDSVGQPGSPNVTPGGIEVKPGQIWRDLDPNTAGRQRRVVAVLDGSAVMCAAEGNNQRISRILVRRMYKHARGWELLSDAAITAAGTTDGGRDE